MNTSNHTHYDDCRLLTSKEASLARDCDCGVSYDRLYAQFMKLEKEYFNLTLRHNNLRKGPICSTEAEPHINIDTDYCTD